MKIESTHAFVKNFKRRLTNQPEVKKKFFERVKLFISDPTSPLLKDHPLKGKKIGLRAFSITGDVRVVYHIKGEVIYFLDIGTHNQVY